MDRTFGPTFLFGYQLREAVRGLPVPKMQPTPRLRGLESGDGAAVPGLAQHGLKRTESTKATQNALLRHTKTQPILETVFRPPHRRAPAHLPSCILESPSTNANM